jgi:hypothetical protein
VLPPNGVGERTSPRQGVIGSPTLPTAGGTQAVLRTETVPVNRTDRRRLRGIVDAIRKDSELMLAFPDASNAIDRLLVAAEITD